MARLCHVTLLNGTITGGYFQQAHNKKFVSCKFTEGHNNGTTSFLSERTLIGKNTAEVTELCKIHAMESVIKATILKWVYMGELS